MCKLTNPDYVINLKNINAPCEILNFCNYHRIKDYAYDFILLTTTGHWITMKIGRSVSGNQFGERIYRQAGHLPGFGANTLTGPSGSDMLLVVDAVKQAYPFAEFDLIKDNILIRLWDVTNEHNPTMDDDAYCTRMIENTLVDEYEAIHGCLPVGNFKDTRNEKSSPFVSSDTFHSLFEEKLLTFDD